MPESPELQQNFFELFSLAPGFEVDAEVLTERFREMQRQFHPDRFAGASAQEKRFSAQISAHINEAYNTLRDELKRAGYLLQLRGVDLASETDTRVAPAFLMMQMELREELEAIPSAQDPFDSADQLGARIMAANRELQQRVATHLAEDDTDGAREAVREWQFYKKLDSELDGVVHALEETLNT